MYGMNVCVQVRSELCVFVILQCVSRGELLVSLSYQPVSHRLNVVVLKAKHLPKLDITGLSGSKCIELSAHTHTPL